MNTKGFELDFKNNVLKINGEEIVLHRKTEETIRVILAKDTAVPERIEMILDAHLDGNPCVGNILVFEPRSYDGEVARGIAVGKALLLTQKTVIITQKGIVLGYCSSVSSVIRKLDTQENSVRKITGELANLLSSSSRSLRSDQTTKLMSLITKRKVGNPLGRSIAVLANSKVILGSVEFPCLKRQTLKTHSREIRWYRRVPEVLEEIHNGRVPQITVAQQEKERSVFYLVTKQLSHHKPTSKCLGHTCLIEGCALVPQYKQFGDTEDSQRTRWPGLEGNKKYARSPFPVYWNRNPGMLLQPPGDRPTRELWTVFSTGRLDAPRCTMSHAAGIIMHQRIMVQFGTKCL
ncbi:hypothetical protein NQ318_020760 [Aromia moschata]|uniref:Uncharacterized protein n=1 Tax=Aromia moschata TaxID=1265417 RepID=A0AAV8Y9L4_9CUCU|nr:hypothetical protein NQ318_020760 [Aromia moschata]